MNLQFKKGPQILALVFLLLPTSVYARRGLSFGTGIMAMTNSTTQGGEGAKGGTLLTQLDMSYHHGMFGWGIFGQYDKQGENEIDTAAGPRIEFTLDPFYLEFGYAAMMNRSYTDRAIAEQTGIGTMLGVGARFALGAAAPGPDGPGRGAFMQFSYKYRSQQIKKQDKTVLDEVITQVDGYPLFGIGFGF